MSNLSGNSGLSLSVGMMETRLALPQRSPSPLACLDLARPRAQRQRVRHRLFGVVVGVDADVVAGDDLHHLARFFHLVGQRAAVGVAQHDPARAAS